jgi:hypothetical protein
MGVAEGIIIATIITAHMIKVSTNSSPVHAAVWGMDMDVAIGMDVDVDTVWDIPISMLV